ncbi:hypothetical protein QVD17_00584 [Tagetes erecta]|uniref:Uncharacterized protein n=1 Tax=Tagetes erecta TaxID=13708 RepID=A0AAD8LBV0_TARER|nr:hypothetical protein QVD17_00584 [Tagetes erecta]
MGDTIAVNHGDEKYMVDIVETKPSPTIVLFKPFTGVARRVDGQPLVVTIVEEIVQRVDQLSIRVDVKKNEKFNAFTGKSGLLQAVSLDLSIQFKRKSEIGCVVVDSPKAMLNLLIPE